MELEGQVMRQRTAGCLSINLMECQGKRHAVVNGRELGDVKRLQNLHAYVCDGVGLRKTGIIAERCKRPSS